MDAVLADNVAAADEFYDKHKTLDNHLSSTLHSCSRITSSHSVQNFTKLPSFLLSQAWFEL